MRLLRTGRNSAPAIIGAVPSGLEVVGDEPVRPRMQRQPARLAAFARHFQMRHAFARMPEILDLQLAQLVAPQRVEQQRREEGAIALAAHGVVDRRVEQLAGLVVAERRRLAFGGFRRRPLHALDRIVGDGVLVTQMLKERGQRGEPMADGAAGKAARHQLVAPGDDMRARHRLRNSSGRAMPVKRTKSRTAFS